MKQLTSTTIPRSHPTTGKNNPCPQWKTVFRTQTARYPTLKLHNTQTAVQKFMFKYSMERRRYILQNISYKQYQIQSLNRFKIRRKTERSHGTGVQSEPKA
jgi:hypothetical protein